MPPTNSVLVTCKLTSTNSIGRCHCLQTKSFWRLQLVPYLYPIAVSLVLNFCRANGCWICVAPVSSLPYSTAVTLHIGPNIPSAEGPLTNPEAKSYYFTTCEEFVVKSTSCSLGTIP